jgi:hypothetical protein
VLVIFDNVATLLFGIHGGTGGTSTFLISASFYYISPLKPR